MKTLWILWLAAVSLITFVAVTPKAWAAKLGLFPAHRDIGSTPKKGNARYDSKKGEYRVTGGGANMWLKTDAFQFVYTQISGDATLTADVHFIGQGVEEHRKAALMIRQNLLPNSAYADVALHGDGLTSLQFRPAANSDTQEMRSDLKAPVRIQIVRHGNQFTMAAGNPGEELKTTGPVTVIMEDPVYIGLAVCSHNEQVLETAIFSNVMLQGGVRQ